ncbi:hypothetical protein EPO15_11710 [bacterium]|nr:MAG: hypothetical protein EPO15_11710 [bacterium]
MGRATLLLAFAAAAFAAEAPPPRGAAPPPLATRAAARFEEMVAGGRKDQSELTALLDELATLRSSYDWERDAGKAEAKRDELRARIGALTADLGERVSGLADALRRFTDEHGLETLERLADERSAGSPDLFSIIKAQTFHAQAPIFLARVQNELRLEEDAWRRFQMLEGERRRYRRTLWVFGLLFLAGMGAAAFYVRAAKRRRRGPPTTTNPGLKGHRKGDIIDLKPE